MMQCSNLDTFVFVQARAAAAAAPAASGQKPEGYNWMDLLLDEEINLLDEEVQQLLGTVQQQQQQPMVTAMDWVLGEYADAAAGSHSFLTLDDEGGYINDSSSHQANWGGGYSNADAAAATAASAAAAAAEGFEYLPAQLGSSDLQRLIQQYSWNVEQHPLLLEGALAAGLYPNYMFGKINQYKEENLEALARSQDGSDIKNGKVSMHCIVCHARRCMYLHACMHTSDNYITTPYMRRASVCS